MSDIYKAKLQEADRVKGIVALFSGRRRPSEASPQAWKQLEVDCIEADDCTVEGAEEAIAAYLESLKPSQPVEETPSAAPAEELASTEPVSEVPDAT